MESINRNHPLRRLFAGLVENAFCTEIGICDPELTAYLADLLVDFTSMDSLIELEEAGGKRLEQVAARLIVRSGDHPATDQERDRTVYRHIGDFTLFWAGVYPEQLKRVSHRPTDVLLDYVSQGKRSYAIVSELAGASELAGERAAPTSSLFRHLSDDFEDCLYGLGQVRRCWELRRTQGGGSGGDLIV